MAYYMGIDIGSTTVKVVVMDQAGQLKFKRYERHFSKVREKTIEVLNELDETLKDCSYHVAITGSAGFGVAKICGIDFVQEVFATAGAVAVSYTHLDVYKRQLVTSLANAAGVTLIGYAYDLFSSYTLSLVLEGVLLWLAMALVVIAYRQRKKLIWEKG